MGKFGFFKPLRREEEKEQFRVETDDDNIVFTTDVIKEKVSMIKNKNDSSTTDSIDDLINELNKEDEDMNIKAEAEDMNIKAGVENNNKDVEDNKDSTDNIHDKYDFDAENVNNNINVEDKNMSENETLNGVEDKENDVNNQDFEENDDIIGDKNNGIFTENSESINEEFEHNEYFVKDNDSVDNFIDNIGSKAQEENLTEESVDMNNHEYTYPDEQNIKDVEDKVKGINNEDKVIFDESEDENYTYNDILVHDDEQTDYVMMEYEKRLKEEVGLGSSDIYELRKRNDNLTSEEVNIINKANKIFRDLMSEEQNEKLNEDKKSMKETFCNLEISKKLGYLTSLFNDFEELSEYLLEYNNKISQKINDMQALIKSLFIRIDTCDLSEARDIVEKIQKNKQHVKDLIELKKYLDIVL